VTQFFRETSRPSWRRAESEAINYRVNNPHDNIDDHFDGANTVLLAPIQGPDSRRQLPTELFTKRPFRFTMKFLMAVVIIAATWAAVITTQQWWVSSRIEITCFLEAIRKPATSSDVDW
jgi:hypothetical protein